MNTTPNETLSGPVDNEGLLVRMQHGELGFVPVICALMIVFLVFHLANPYFLTPRNMSNLTLQLGVLGIMALGVSLVLFIGEIDLSAGSVSGACAVVLVILSAKLGVPGLLAVTSAMAAGAVIGWIHGTCITLIGAPSFIVTLTGLLVWQGVQRMLVGNQIGQMLINDPLVTNIASTYLPSRISLALIGIITIVAIVHYRHKWRSRPAQGTGARMSRWGEASLYPLLALAIFVVLTQHAGVPVLLLLLVTIALLLTMLTEHTPFGVHVFAIGGNAEAARRAGINVTGIRVLLFAMCSSLAALSGVISVSRQYAVDSNTGGGNLVLDAIAAAVIGGTSLFGGRGRILGSLLGALVIGSVANGLDLLGHSANVKSIITGLILLAAVSVDMIARKRRIRSGAAGA